MGAGASYGKREKDSNGKDIPGRITEGLPTVDEIPMRLEKVKEIFEQLVLLINVLQRIGSGFSKDRIIPKTNVSQFFLPPEL